MSRTFTTTFVLALTMTAAQAGDAITVHYGDLDLSRPGDSQILDSRIQQAAETACISFRGSRTSMFYETWFSRCVSDATARTSAQVAALTSGKYRAVASK